MSEKEQLIKKLEQAPDFLVRQVLNFLLFIKTYVNENSNQEPSQNVYLYHLKRISSQWYGDRRRVKQFTPPGFPSYPQQFAC